MANSINDEKVVKVEMIKKLPNHFAYYRTYTNTIDEAQKIMITDTYNSILYCMMNYKSARTILKPGEIHCYTLHNLRGSWCWCSIVSKEDANNNPATEVDIPSLNQEDIDNYWHIICKFVKQHNKEFKEQIFG